MASVAMLILYLPLAVFAFSVKLISFVIARKARIIIGILIFSLKETSSLPFAVNAILNLSIVCSKFGW